ncbi:2OG-Fe(II) oxygenase [Streptomycetaceae bacterium NBC_01309]
MLVTEDRLSAGALNALLAGQALAVRIPGYLEGALCAELTARLLAALDELGGYERIYRSHVPAFTDTAGDGRARDAYFAAASRAMALVRARCRPYASPMDRLRCELDECWPGGAGLLRVAGSPLVFGMLRVWQNGAQALPHLDVLGAPRAAPPVARRFTEQLGANVYLSVPRPEPAPPAAAGVFGAVEADGAIEVWDAGRETRGRLVRGYGYAREAQREPDLVVRPVEGDLVLIRTSLLHAVRPTVAGRRVTLSGFIGHAGGHEPLRLWS